MLCQLLTAVVERDMARATELIRKASDLENGSRLAWPSFQMSCSSGWALRIWGRVMEAGKALRVRHKAGACVRRHRPSPFISCNRVRGSEATWSLLWDHAGEDQPRTTERACGVDLFSSNGGLEGS